MIKMILACDLNGVIGNNGELPWGRSLPYDLKRFKELTEGHIVVMGRKTFESLGSKPLPNRENIVLTSGKQSVKATFDPFSKTTHIYFSRNIDAILYEYDHTGGDRDLWVIGGMNVYEQFMPYVQEVHLTEVRGVFEGDTGLNAKMKCELCDHFISERLGFKGKDDKNEYDMSFFKLTRIKGEYK